MQKRITNEPVDNVPMAREHGPTVRAKQMWAWRCPDCGLLQFAEKSSTHEAKCNRCIRPFTVDIK